MISLYSTLPFDAANAHTFKFFYSGSQANSNQLLIKNATTDVVIYDSILTTPKLEHTVPSNTLTNGVTYTAQIKAIDIGGTSSSYSSPILFRCLSTPTWYFKDFLSNTVIKNSYFNIDLLYQQAQGELLNSYQISLCDITQNEVFNTGKIYDSSLTYRLTGLVDGQQYYIKAYGDTVNGMLFTTELIPFSVSYSSPFSTSLVSLTNLPYSGCIRIDSNIATVNATQSNDNLIYIDGTKLSLINGEWVNFDYGIKINSNFTLQLKCQNLIPFKPFFTLYGINDKIELTYIEKRIYKTTDGSKTYSDVAYIKVNSRSGLISQTICTENFDVLTASKIVDITLRRVDGILDAKAVIS